MKQRLLAFGLLVCMLFGSLTIGASASDAYAWQEMEIDELPTGGGMEDPQYYKEQQSAEELPQVRTAARAGDVQSAFAGFITRPLQKGETVRYGIDVSSYQKDIDWKAVAQSGVEFAIIRVGGRYYGTAGAMYRDDYYEKNIKEAKANGIKVGAYIFSQAITVEEGIEEAQFLMKLLKGEKMDLPLVIDYEYVATGVGRLYNAHLSQRAATDICKAFCKEVESRGYQSMVYANYYMLRDQLYAEELSRVWLANYNAQTSYPGAYEYWQCSSTGKISGIAGNCDLDIWYDSGFPFQDVPADRWDYPYISWAYENSMVNGVSSTAFEPATVATRGQLVTILYRMNNSPAVDGPSSFTDLKEDYYLDAVAWAEQNKITTGQSATTFGPDDSIRREDLATLLYRQHLEPITNQSLDAYSDAAAVSDYAQKAMAWAVEKGVLQGYQDNTLRPGAPTTRAEVCAILMRYSDLIQSEMAD